MQIPPRNKQKFILNKISSSAIFFVTPPPHQNCHQAKSGQHLLSPVGTLSWRIRLQCALLPNLSQQTAQCLAACCTTHPRRCTLWMRSRVQWAAWPSGRWRTAVSSGLKPGSFRSCKRSVHKFLKSVRARQRPQCSGATGLTGDVGLSRGNHHCGLVSEKQREWNEILIHSDTRLI